MSKLSAKPGKTNQGPVTAYMQSSAPSCMMSCEASMSCIAGPSPEMKVKALDPERKRQRPAGSDVTFDAGGKSKNQILRPYIVADDTPMSPSSVKKTGTWMGTAGTRPHGQEATPAIGGQAVG